jgi:hypothetical protein
MYFWLITELLVTGLELKAYRWSFAVGDVTDD